MKRLKKFIYPIVSIVLVAVAMGRIVYVKWGAVYQIDFAAYCAISKALWQGLNPFPDQTGVLMVSFGEHVPIVYPGQMLLFALPGFLWSDGIQIAYLVLNVITVFLLTGMTLVRACGFQWRDLVMPGLRQFLFALCCSGFLTSSNFMDTIRIGQIPVILAACFYGMFWMEQRPAVLRPFFFALVAVCKYSLLPVVAPIFFIKGYRKLCLVAFSIFLLMSLSPVLRGNSLREVYVGYSEAVKVICSPGGINHYTARNNLVHFGFFHIASLNHFLKIVIVCIVLGVFLKEWRLSCISDTLMLLCFSLTMLVCYHSLYDYSIVFPLFFIRLFHFGREKAWWRFGITLFFPLYLCVPGRIMDMLASRIGTIPHIGSIVYLSDSWNHHFHHMFPIHACFAIALALWSLYLYFSVKTPYRFEMSSGISTEKNIKAGDCV